MKIHTSTNPHCMAPMKTPSSVTLVHSKQGQWDASPAEEAEGEFITKALARITFVDGT
jgi:hypothetical protein